MSERDLDTLLDEAVGTPDVDAAWIENQKRLRRATTKRRSITLIGAAACIVVALGVAISLADDGKKAVVVTPTPTPATFPPEPVASEPIDAAWQTRAALEAKYGTDASVMVWTGRELFVWGGYVGDPPWSRNGAIYNVEQDSWRAIPPAPRVLTTPVAKKIGGEIVIFGTEGGFAWDIEKETWRDLVDLTLPERKPTVQGPIAFGDGEVFLPATGYRYLLANNELRDIGPPPVQGYMSAAWDGTDYVVVIDLQTYTYAPNERKWTGPIATAAGMTHIVSDHGYAFAVGHDWVVRTFDHKRQAWLEIDQPPSYGTCGMTIHIDGDYALATSCGAGAIMPLNRMRWTPLGMGMGANTAIGAGLVLSIQSGMTGDVMPDPTSTADFPFTVLPLHTNESGDVRPPSRIPFGNHHLQIADGWRFRNVSVRPAQDDITMLDQTFDIVDPAGRECRVYIQNLNDDDADDTQSKQVMGLPPTHEVRAQEAQFPGRAWKFDFPDSSNEAPHMGWYLNGQKIEIWCDTLAESEAVAAEFTYGDSPLTFQATG